MTLTKPFPRLWSLAEGVAMVVTDLHGDWEAYRRYRDRFVDWQATGRADWLILTGDLIHRQDPNAPDHSLDMVLDVIALQAAYEEAVIYLCGNHELPHIYGISLAKGERVYTPDFEAALSRGQRRAEVTALFDSLPFYLRTRAGVSVTHAGAAAPLAVEENVEKLFAWSHQALLAEAAKLLENEDLAALRKSYARLQQLPYDALAQYYLAVSGPEDPRYNDLLLGFVAGGLPPFTELLWPALFTRCEEEYGEADYAIFLEVLLEALALDFYPQHLLVAGHMTIPGGDQVIARRHLRLASAPHATPREAGRYLLFDAAQPVQKMKALSAGLESVF